MKYVSIWEDLEGLDCKKISAALLVVFFEIGNQLMVNCWFGARWFGFLEFPYERGWQPWVYPDSNPKPPGPKPTINH